MTELARGAGEPPRGASPFTLTPLPVNPLEWTTHHKAGAAKHQWLAAYGDFSEAEHSREWRRLEVEGKVPPGLNGVLRRILAGRHQIGDLRYHHWWDGDGALAEFRISQNEIYYRARYIETTKLQHERAAGRAIYEQFATAAPGLVRPVDLDDMNPANVAILDYGGELLALGDWCSAWRIDRTTLDGLGRKEWSSETAGAPFSAHPKIDGDGHLWSIGYEPWRGRLHLYHLSPDSNLKNHRILNIPEMGFTHDFIITDQYIVVPLTSTRWSKELEASGKSLMDCLEFRPESPIRVLLIRKSDLQIETTYELPPGMIYHCSNGYQQPGGDIKFHCCYFADADYMFGTFRQVMLGGLYMGSPPVQMLVTLPADGSAAKSEFIPVIGELPRVDERFFGRYTKYAWLCTPGDLNGPPDKFGFSALTRLNLETGVQDSYHFGADIIAEEPAFAPDPASTSEGEGWMVGTFFDISQKRTAIAIFNAMRLSDGPLACAYLPSALPIGVHGNFHPR